jgi:hypothetical protein
LTPVARWTCPRCDREFGRANQSHVCVPGSSIDATFAGRPPALRAIADAVIAHVRTLGPVHLDAVEVGVFLKRARTLVEIRPQARALTLWIVLDHFVRGRHVTRHVTASSTRSVSVVKLTSMADFDDDVRAWLDEAYAYAE